MIGDRCLILGIGNILLQDEGVGVRVIEHVQAHYTLPEHVQVLDGGTLGLDLLSYIENVGFLLVVDAVDCKQPPGTIIRLVDDEIPAFLGQKISPHQLGLSDILSVARLRDMMPAKVVLIGVQPAVVETGLELSPVISAKVEVLAEAVVREVGVET